MYPALLFSLAAFGVALLSWLWKKSRHPLSELPGPPQAPVVGSLPWFDIKAPQNAYQNFRRYGDLVRFTILKDEFLLVYKPEHVREVLIERRHHYSKGPGYKNGMGKYLGNSILIADHEDWKPQRKLLQPLFTPKAMERYTHMVAAKSDAVCDGLDALMGEREAVTLEMSRELRKVILDFVGIVGFGHDFEASADVGIRDSRIVTAMDTCLEFSERAGFGLPGFLYRPLIRRYEAERAWIREQIRDVVRSDGDANTILGLMKVCAAQEGNAWLTEEMMVDQTFTFLVAGSDTTAHSIATILQMVCEHPEVYERLQAEVDAFFEKHGDAPPTSYLAIKEDLPYLDMVNSETLRMFPSVPAVGRYADVPTQIGEQSIPAGVMVIVSPIATHHDPRFWEDPQVFRPGRFADEEQPRSGGAPTFFPFVYGSRNCIGVYLSKLYTFLFLLAFLRRYRVQLPPGTPPLSRDHLRTRMTLMITTGSPMEIRRR